jgi:alkanesulfonate monooxygenase SsuD/methylene tetrahydromethanopterin reductase-like flavin-dependent oxidoreductase (luciferase family)
VKFGLFFELSVPRPWDERSDRRVFELALEQVMLADELGFDQTWVVEHHFLEEYSHSSAPELWLTAVACNTKNIRLGRGICTVLPGMNHPIRAAEQAAWLDIISNGRLEFGTGRSSTWTELGGFGIDPDATKDLWDEALRMLPKIWTQDDFSWDSPTYKIPPRNVVPKPLQKPHPPLWVAVSSPETAEQAGERGIGMVGVSIGTPKEQEERIRDYHRRIQGCEPVGEFVNAQANTMNWLYVDEDRERGRKTGERLIASFNRLATGLAGINQVYPAQAYNTPGLLFALRRDSMASGKALIRDGFAIGDPDDVVGALKMWESIGVDGVQFLVNSNQVIAQEDVLNSLRLFAREVMPHFAKGDNPIARTAAGVFPQEEKERIELAERGARAAAEANGDGRKPQEIVLESRPTPAEALDEASALIAGRNEP